MIEERTAASTAVSGMVRGERNPRVLVIEDDDPVRMSVDAALAGEGYEVRAEVDGMTVAQVLREFRPDLGVLDVRLPQGPDGFQIARRLRGESDLPVLFLTSADSVEDRLAGFDAGGDDYLVKPFFIAELQARVRALLQRTGRLRSAVRQVGDLMIDETAGTVVLAGTELSLTRIEHDLLVTLARRPGHVLSKTQLLAAVWGYDAYDENLVEVHISSLRRKLEEHAPRIVHTVREMGYVLRS